MSDIARSVLDDEDPFAGGDVVPMRLGDAVIQRITQAIHDGRLKPGDFLPSEARIAASFGVSKPIAREAIRQLAAMGVVHIQQGKPTRVRALDAAPLDRFYRFAVRGRSNGLTEAVELRRILEPPTAAHSAERRSAEDLEKLDLILARMEDALGNVPRWIEADLDFHEAVAASSGNRLARLPDPGPEAGDPRGDGDLQFARGPWPRGLAAHLCTPCPGRRCDPGWRCGRGFRRHEQAFRSGRSRHRGTREPQGGSP
ncbi:FadR family transcriptional regulator [Bosea sp. NBC_00550]|nr:FadR/GntR family transcriptional regulator [Bosea sp. NBC_00550]UZF91038.1 FadR family transcriptional regulator [Bosea sp. NBC_00550]